MLVQTIFLSSTLAYADDIIVNNNGSNANGGYIVTQSENEAAEIESEITKEEDISIDSQDKKTTTQEVSSDQAAIQAKQVAIQAKQAAAEQEKTKFKSAVISFIKSKNNRLGDADATKAADAAIYASDKNNVDINLILAVMWKESYFTANARNASCYGIMQVSKNTAAGFGFSVKDLNDPYRNADVASRLLKGQINKYKNPVMGLTAYNAGSGNVSRGNYTTAYANNVISKSNAVKTYINSYISK